MNKEQNRRKNIILYFLNKLRDVVYHIETNDRIKDTERE